jgi:mRNA-degrading endonuclease HigB of HigAB toxin-antitoxin module
VQAWGRLPEPNESVEKPADDAWFFTSGNGCAAHRPGSGRVVFNIKANDYRLIALVQYENGVMMIRYGHFLT